jgi:membrane-bound serine protease (ClpP class)
VFVVGAIIRGQRRRKATGAEGMIGTTAIAKTPLDPTGTVLTQGELWTAESESGKIAPREEVIITKVEALKLWVTKKSKE